MDNNGRLVDIAITKSKEKTTGQKQIEYFTQRIVFSTGLLTFS